MFRSNLLKLSVTLVLLAATAFVSVTAVAADPWYPTKADDAAFASNWDWVDRRSSFILSGDAAMSTLDNPNGRWIGPETVSAALGQSAALPTLDPDHLASLNGGRSAGLATLDNPSGYWIGPETVSAALSQFDDSNGRWIGPETVSAVLGQLQP